MKLVKLMGKVTGRVNFHVNLRVVVNSYYMAMACALVWYRKQYPVQYVAFSGQSGRAQRVISGKQAGHQYPKGDIAHGF